MSDVIEVSCEMELTLKVIGGKWKPLILYYLIGDEPKRYTEILRFLKSAHKRTLTNQLRELEEDAVISRKVFATVPPQVEYALTERGKTLIPLLEMMCQWGCDHADPRFVLTNAQCCDPE